MKREIKLVRILNSYIQLYYRLIHDSTSMFYCIRLLLDTTSTKIFKFGARFVTFTFTTDALDPIDFFPRSLFSFIINYTRVSIMTIWSFEGTTVLVWEFHQWFLTGRETKCHNIVLVTPKGVDSAAGCISRKISGHTTYFSGKNDHPLCLSKKQTVDSFSRQSLFEISNYSVQWWFTSIIIMSLVSRAPQI